jgi:polar amino acid transport system substrate-binding protein
MARNPKIEVISGHTKEFIDAFCFAVSSENIALRDSLNKTLEEMRGDGTLEKLRKEYINVTENPASVEFGNFGDAETLKVAVTGDLPPLDLILPDGKPAGFNTAVLSEIGKRLHKNIEIIQVDSASRAAALTSGKADIVFWVILPLSEVVPQNVDKPEGMELTSPYYRGRIIHIRLKK